MTPTLAILALRSLGMLFGLQGQPKAASSLGLLADGIESGANVDAHMASVAAAIKSGSPLDWDDVHDRIVADSNRLQA